MTSPPVVDMPDWDRWFQPHTDARELEAGTVLTQIHEGSERVLGYASHRWYRADVRRLPTEREMMAVLWAVDHFITYVWGRRFTLITEFSALTWLFRGRDLSSKHMWTLRLTEYDMEEQWWPGTRHQLPDASSRLPRSESPREDIKETFPDDSSSLQTYRRPEGPVLNGVPLTQLGGDQVDESIAEGVVTVSGAAITPRGAADNVEGAAEVLRFPRLLKPTRREEIDFSGGDGENFEGLASLEEIGGVTRAVTRAFPRATSQTPSAPTAQQSHQQPQLA